MKNSIKTLIEGFAFYCRLVEDYCDRELSHYKANASDFEKALITGDIIGLYMNGDSGNDLEEITEVREILLSALNLVDE